MDKNISDRLFIRSYLYFVGVPEYKNLSISFAVFHVYLDIAENMNVLRGSSSCYKSNLSIILYPYRRYRIGVCTDFSIRVTHDSAYLRIEQGVIVINDNTYTTPETLLKVA